MRTPFSPQGVVGRDSLAATLAFKPKSGPGDTETRYPDDYLIDGMTVPTPVPVNGQREGGASLSVELVAT